MKEQTLMEMKNKIETLGSVVQTLMIEIQNLKTLSLGNSKVIKNMTEYEEAIEKLKKETARKAGSEQKIISD